MAIWLVLLAFSGAAVLLAWAAGVVGAAFAESRKRPIKKGYSAERDFSIRTIRTNPPKNTIAIRNASAMARSPVLKFVVISTRLFMLCSVSQEIRNKAMSFH